MRTELEGIFNDSTLLADLDSALPEGSVRELNPAGRRRIVILVTKEAHCLGDLLMKANYGGLDVEIAAVIGNHETLRSLVERFDIPFELVSHEGLSRNEHDQKMADAIEAHQPDYVVLAKYMRVLTPESWRASRTKLSTFTIHSCQRLSAHVPIIRLMNAA